MVDEVNRLVGNLLAAGSGVFLPGVGSLFVERRGARRLSKRSVQPPCRVVSFSSQQQGVSLADELARTLHCDAAGAQDVYDRWLSRTREGDVLTIEGVGVLKFKNFTLAPAFDRLLNPQGHEPVRIKPARRLDWALWVGIAAIGIAAVYGGREFLLLYPEAPEAAAVTEIPAASDSFGTVEAPDALVEAPPTERSVAGVSAAQAGGAASGASVPDAAPEPEIAETHPAQEQDVPTALLSGRHYVVLGVFSTEENARRAVRETEARESALRCRIYRFGGKFMVSPFSSDDAGACAQFIRVQDGRFPDMWTYTAR